MAHLEDRTLPAPRRSFDGDDLMDGWANGVLHTHCFCFMDYANAARLHDDLLLLLFVCQPFYNDFVVFFVVFFSSHFMILEPIIPERDGIVFLISLRA